MPFEKGRSGNPKGRPRQTAEQKSQKEQFQRLLKSSTIDALQSIIQIASDRYNKDRFKTNNCIENLEVVTCKQNINYGTANKRRAKSIKRYYRERRQAVACC